MRQERRYYQTVGRIYFFELYKALYRMIAKLCERYDIQLLVMLNQTQESSLIYQLDWWAFWGVTFEKFPYSCDNEKETRAIL